MKPTSKKALINFIKGIPTSKRHLSPNLSNPLDFKRMVIVSTSLLENDEVITIEDIKSVCEEVGGEEYFQLIKREHFEDMFCDKIISRINNIKEVIRVYKEVSTKTE